MDCFSDSLLAGVITLVGLIAAFWPATLGGGCCEMLQNDTARTLGKDVFYVIDGYVSNDEGARQESYRHFGDLLEIPGYESKEAKTFRDRFVEAFLDLATVKQKPFKQGLIKDSRSNHQPPAKEYHNLLPQRVTACLIVVKTWLGGMFGLG